MWNRRRFLRRDSDLEATLRGSRSEAREEFVEGVSRRVLEERPRQRAAWSRLAFAGAVSTLILGSFASFGGVGYAVSGASSTYQLAKELAVDPGVSVDRSSAAAQYAAPPETPQEETAGTEGTAQALGSEAENLPFTGISLLATVIVGFALLGTGIFLRRRERRET
jgi:hypothetical protein